MKVSLEARKLYLDIPFSKYADLLDSNLKPVWQNIAKVFLIRYGLALIYGDKVYHPDQYWQGMETAYYMAYSD